MGFCDIGVFRLIGEKLVFKSFFYKILVLKEVENGNGEERKD